MIKRPATSSAEMFLLMFQAGYPPFAVTMILVTLAVSMIILISGIASGGTFLPIATIGGIVILLLFLLVFLIALIRVLWTLLKAYVFVVLNLIFAPFQILVGTLPGSNAIGSWFRNLAANLAVLPTVLAMVFLSGYLTLAGIDQYLGALTGPLNQYLEGTEKRIVLIEMMGNIIRNFLDPNDPAKFSALFAMFILFGVSVAILLLTPKAADMIKAFLAGRPFEYGTAFGEAMRPIIVPAGYIAGIGREAAVKGISGYLGAEITTRLGERFARPERERTTAEAERAGRGEPPSV